MGVEGRGGGGGAAKESQVIIEALPLSITKSQRVVIALSHSSDGLGWPQLWRGAPENDGKVKIQGEILTGGHIDKEQSARK